jgi:hypothetical protein
MTKAFSGLRGSLIEFSSYSKLSSRVMRTPFFLVSFALPMMCIENDPEKRAQRETAEARGRKESEHSYPTLA